MPSQVTSRMRSRRNAIAVASIIVCLIAIGRATYVLVEWLWFSSIGYAAVFWTMLDSRVLLFAAVFAISAVLIALSGFLAHRHATGIGPFPVVLEVVGKFAEDVAPRIPWRSRKRRP